jgi:hypothetical protein
MNDVTELRTLLFDTIRAVKAGDLAVDKAKAISELSGRVIEMARWKPIFSRLPAATSAPALFPSRNPRPWHP